MSAKNILVTGANRGLGFAVVQALATRFAASSFFLGVRDVQSGAQAVEKLRAFGLQSSFHIVELDVTNDRSIESALSFIRSKCQSLDVLINNAAIANTVKPGESGFRDAFNATMDANVASVLQLTTSFIPLLRSSASPSVICISSARASIQLQAQGALPPTASLAYSISKTALNVAVLELIKTHPGITIHAVSPGHLKTSLNSFRGTKDPIDGARVVVELLDHESGTYESGFWEYEETVRKVPW